jgi:hypothetical protein
MEKDARPGGVAKLLDGGGGMAHWCEPKAAQTRDGWRVWRVCAVVRAEDQARVALLAGFSMSAWTFFNFWTFGSDTARMYP